jgi:hypothetical protein
MCIEEEESLTKNNRVYETTAALPITFTLGYLSKVITNEAAVSALIGTYISHCGGVAV